MQSAAVEVEFGEAFIAGKHYKVPLEKLGVLSKFIKEVFTPGIPANTPSNIRALSFSVLLKDYYEEHFSEYEVKP